MSSILLSNPFVTPAPPPFTWGSPETRLAVAPAKPSQSSGDSTGHSGTGQGYGGGNPALSKSMRSDADATRAPNAAPSSVINAQTQGLSAREDTARAMLDFRMPDPLPTSPYLKPA